jgi:hypothetical protein
VDCDGGGLKKRTLSVRRITKEIKKDAKGGTNTDPSAPIGINICNYLGAVGVGGQKGATVAEAGVKRAAAREDMNSTAAACIVSLTGLKIVAARCEFSAEIYTRGCHWISLHVHLKQTCV